MPETGGAEKARLHDEQSQEQNPTTPMLQPNYAKGQPRILLLKPDFLRHCLQATPGFEAQQHECGNWGMEHCGGQKRLTAGSPGVRTSRCLCPGLCPSGSEGTEQSETVLADAPHYGARAVTAATSES